jgi:hypothetical protein
MLTGGRFDDPLGIPGVDFITLVLGGTKRFHGYVPGTVLSAKVFAFLISLHFCVIKFKQH